MTGQIQTNQSPATNSGFALWGADVLRRKICARFNIRSSIKVQC